MKFTKICRWLFCLTLCVNCSSQEGHKQNDENENETEKVPDGIITDETKQEIKTFFSNRLAGNAARYASEIVIPADKAEANADAVWAAWKAANKNFTEEKLAAPGNLENAVPGRWTLPSELEPNAVMPYYWGTKGNKPEEGYPLFLYLHGSGDKGSEWATGLSLSCRFDDAPSAYFIPQIPNTGNYYRWWQKAKQFAWEKLLRQAFVSGDIDPNRVYFFGISEGGYGSQRLASFYADYLAGAGPMAGGEPLKNAPAENCANIAFSLRTGAEDSGFYRNILTTYTREELDRLKSEHPGYYVHDIQLIPDMGHSIDYTPTTPWLKQYVRNPHPRYVNWENFEMDGLYRNGFYNLYVAERSNADMNSRTHYEMSISENKITLQVNNVSYTATETDPRWGIEMKFSKSSTPATRGRIIVYLNDDLVDLNKEVTLTVNGKQAFKGKPKIELKNMVNSCAVFFDPERIYPAAVEVDLSSL